LHLFTGRVPPEDNDVVAHRLRAPLAEHEDLALVRQDDVHDHPDRCRLAGSIGADESVDDPSGTSSETSSTAR
jgi:hypothetical protein